MRLFMVTILLPAWLPSGEGVRNTRTDTHANGSKRAGIYLAIAFATNYALLNEKDKAFEWLDRAYEERAPGLLDLDLDPESEN
jgi:hypothetical protein